MLRNRFASSRRWQGHGRGIWVGGSERWKTLGTRSGDAGLWTWGSCEGMSWAEMITDWPVRDGGFA
jgi:hypothetical protein